MKPIYRISVLLSLMVILIVGCTKNFEEVNIDPNNPKAVPTFAFLTNVEKQMCDFVFDSWWGGRQSTLWAQYWSQNNYTDEDRYNIRQNVNNIYWRNIFTLMSDLVEIERLNTNEETKGIMSGYGHNAYQIASANILKAWLFQHLTDLYGDIPFSEALKGYIAEPIYLPKYDKQADIYPAIMEMLKEASTSIAVTQADPEAFGWTQGDIIYKGDMEKWKRFANSLILRMALRLKNADAAKAQEYINYAMGSGVMQSNDDNATFKYIGVPPNAAPMWNAYYIDARYDFAVTAQFTDLLKGVPVGGAKKTNPFAGVADPRLPVFADPVQDTAIFGQGIHGMPYGMGDDETKKIGVKGASWPGEAILAADYSCVLMSYAEVAFIHSELNNWNQAHYEAGIRASMQYWGIPDTDINAFIAAIPAATEETVLTQKYIALYPQGYEGWSEYRRTGYPKTLVHPGEVTYITPEGNAITFDALTGNAIPRRLTYPQEEQTVNKTNYGAAATQMGGDEFATRMWWDKP
jgi:hypothetical protein